MKEEKLKLMESWMNIKMFGNQGIDVDRIVTFKVSDENGSGVFVEIDLEDRRLSLTRVAATEFIEWIKGTNKNNSLFFPLHEGTMAFIKEIDEGTVAQLADLLTVHLQRKIDTGELKLSA